MWRMLLVAAVVASAWPAAASALAAGDDAVAQTPTANAPRAAPPAAPSADKPASTPARRSGDADRADRRGNGHSRTVPIYADATDDEIADIMAFTGEYLPWLRQDLEKTRQSDPDRFRQMCRKLRFEVSQLRGLKDRDAGAFQKAIEARQLKARAQDLAAKVRTAADPAEKQALTVQLRQVLDKMVDAEMVTRQAHIRGLEERLDTLKREMKERAAHREEILQKRVDEMLKSTPESAGGSSADRSQPKR